MTLHDMLRASIGWIPHEGPCPVGLGQKVTIRMKGGAVHTKIADHVDWSEVTEYKVMGHSYDGQGYNFRARRR